MKDAGKVIGVLAILAAAFYAARSFATTDSGYSEQQPAGNFWDGWGFTDPAQQVVQPDVPLPDYSTDAYPSPQPQETELDMSAAWKTNEYPKYAEVIAAAEDSYRIPRDLLARLLYQESRFRQDVIDGTNRSPVGAMGIAQFMPATAAELGVNRLDPLSSIWGAAKYLKQMYNKFNNWGYALMAYNWGPGNVSKWLQGTIQNPPAETQTYWSAITADVPVA